MTDPFRGELTSRYTMQENLAWAARERLISQMRPAVVERKPRWLSVEINFGGMLNRVAQSLAQAV